MDQSICLISGAVTFCYPLIIFISTVHIIILTEALTMPCSMHCKSRYTSKLISSAQPNLGCQQVSPAIHQRKCQLRGTTTRSLLAKTIAKSWPTNKSMILCPHVPVWLVLAIHFLLYCPLSFQNPCVLIDSRQDVFDTNCTAPMPRPLARTYQMALFTDATYPLVFL